MAKGANTATDYLVSGIFIGLFGGVAGYGAGAATNATAVAGLCSASSARWLRPSSSSAASRAASRSGCGRRTSCRVSLPLPPTLIYRKAKVPPTAGQGDGGPARLNWSRTVLKMLVVLGLVVSSLFGWHTSASADAPPASCQTWVDQAAYWAQEAAFWSQEFAVAHQNFETAHANVVRKDARIARQARQIRNLEARLAAPEPPIPGTYGPPPQG